MGLGGDTWLIKFIQALMQALKRLSRVSDIDRRLTSQEMFRIQL